MNASVALQRNSLESPLGFVLWMSGGGGEREGECEGERDEEGNVLRQ